MLSKRRTVRVFISGTFRDFHAERDYLIKNVFPEIQKEISKRTNCFIEIIPIDLRWGITEEESQSGQHADICLEEVKRCKFIISFLGERYGWIPPEKKVSITELEIEQGILRKTPKSYGFFYFRDSSFTEFLEHPEQKEIYFDVLPNGLINEEAKYKLKSLKERIQQRKYPVFVYTPQFDQNLSTSENTNLQKPTDWNVHATKGRLTGFEILGQKIKSDLLTAISQEFPDTETVMTPFEEENVMQAAFENERSQIYFGREKEKKNLTSLVQQTKEQKPVVVLGAPGSGKSAFLAKWAEEYRKKYPKDWLFTHFIGATPNSTSLPKMLERICTELKCTFSLIKTEIPTDIKGLQKTLEQFLYEANLATSNRIILVIDALNQLEPIYDAHILGWLPEFLPDKVKLIVSTLPGQCLDSLHQRQICEFSLPPLKKQTSNDIIVHFLRKWGKKLDRTQLGILLDKAGVDNPLFLRVVLEELRVYGSFELLSQRIKEFPNDIVSLFAQVLGRLESEFGSNLVRRILSLIACSRYGLEEQEILQLLKDPSGKPLPSSSWLRIYYNLPMYLVQRGSFYNFFHSQLEEAVKACYLSDKTRIEQHKYLADFFEIASENRKLTEFPYQLQQSEQWERLAEILSDPDFFTIATSDSPFWEVMSYWVAIGEKYSPVQYYTKKLCNLEKQQSVSTESLAHLYSKIGILLGKLGLFKDQVSFLEKSLDLIQRRFGPEHLDVADACHELALSYDFQGAYSKALELYEKAKKIRINKLGPDHAEVGTVYYNLARVHQHLGQYEKAIELHSKALEIKQLKLGKNHYRVAYSFQDLASCYIATAQYNKAIELYEKALEIYVTQVGSDYPYIGFVYHGRGFIDEKLGKYDKAVEFFEKALKSLSKLGETHPFVANVYSNLGKTYLAQGEYNKAIEILNKGLAISLKRLGADHPDIARYYYSHLGRIYEEMGSYQKALEYHKKALDVYSKTLDANHPDIAGILQFSGRDYEGLEQYDRALELYEKSLSLLLLSLSPDHPGIAFLYRDLASVHCSLKHYEISIELYEKSLKILKSKFVDGHPGIAMVYQGLSSVYAGQELYEKSLEFLDRAISIQSLTLSSNHPDLGKSYLKKGIVLGKCNHSKESSKYLKKAYLILQSKLDSDHPILKECKTFLEKIIEH